MKREAHRVSGEEDQRERKGSRKTCGCRMRYTLSGNTQADAVSPEQPRGGGHQACTAWY